MKKQSNVRELTGLDFTREGTVHECSGRKDKWMEMERRKELRKDYNWQIIPKKHEISRRCGTEDGKRWMNRPEEKMDEDNVYHFSYKIQSLFIASIKSFQINIFEIHIL